MARTKEELELLKVKELRDVAKEYKIKGYWNIPKAELISAIIKADTPEDVEEETEADVDTSENRMKNYIENAQVGTIVAFVDRTKASKYRSAKIVKRSTSNRKFLVETDYGAQFKISFDDVIWVRTGKRWPKGVYRLLKGLVDENGKDAETSKEGTVCNS